MGDEGPYELTEEERICVAAIRERIPDIPHDLNTDLNLRRWHKGWKVDEIVPRFSSYIRNRAAAGYDRPDFVAHFVHIPVVKNYLHYYSISRFLEPVIEKKSNSVMFLQRVGGVFHEDLCRTITTSDILLLYFAFCELSLRHILTTEAATGRPSAILVILDLKNVPIQEFVNPNSPANVLMRLCMNIFQEWYCEFLHKSLVVNPPTVVNILWQVGKACLSETTLSKIVVAPKLEDLQSHMDMGAIPVAYGGSFLDSSGWGVPEFGSPNPKPITAEDHYPVGKMWTVLEVEGISEPEKERDWVKPGKALRLERKMKAGQTLAWSFFINGQMSFRVIHTDGDSEVNVKPEFSLSTIVLPDEGHFTASADGLYALEFRNTSSYVFSIKIDYTLALK